MLISLHAVLVCGFMSYNTPSMDEKMMAPFSEGVEVPPFSLRLCEVICETNHLLTKN